MLFVLLSPLVLSQALPTQSIKYHSPALIPESFAFSQSQQVFYMGSVGHGTVSSVDYNGNIKTVIPAVTGGNSLTGPIVPPPTGLGVLGVKMDKDGNIYTCLSDATKLSLTTGIADGGISYVAKYDKNFKKLYISQLPQKKSNICNDLAIKDDVVFVTDTGSGYLFTMNAATGAMTELKIPGAIMLDGVDYKDDYVLVSDIATKKIFKIRNNAVTEVQGVTAAYDSIIFTQDRKTLLGVNPDGYTFLTSDDDFKSVKNITKPLPRPGSAGTSFIPLSATVGAITGSENFNPNVTDYQIDLVQLINSGSSGSSGYNTYSSASTATAFTGIFMAFISTIF